MRKLLDSQKTAIPLFILDKLNLTLENGNVKIFELKSESNEFASSIFFRLHKHISKVYLDERK